jgi:hypothetical protein
LKEILHFLPDCVIQAGVQDDKAFQGKLSVIPNAERNLKLVFFIFLVNRMLLIFQINEKRLPFAKAAFEELL